VQTFTATNAAKLYCNEVACVHGRPQKFFQGEWGARSICRHSELQCVIGDRVGKSQRNY